MSRPLLLDLFCCAGGVGMGYHRAGFDVTGVDLALQKRYPFRFIQGDALEYVAAHGHEYDAIHASPPCQRFTALNGPWKGDYADLIDPTREALIATGKPYVIENVPAAPLRDPLMLCGTMFGLHLLRHRIFEVSPTIHFPPAPCSHWKKGIRSGRRADWDKHYISVNGHFADQEQARRAMGIDWMTREELAEAIPPAYTEWLGAHLLRIVQATREGGAA